MNPSKLKESATIELKESFTDDALKSLCAFANTKGGSLFVGVKDDTTLIGGEISDKAQQKYVNQIESVLGIQPEMIIHQDENNEFLEIKISKSETPVDVRGRFYKRIGNTTREIDRDGLKAFLLKDVPWDSQIRENSTFDDLNDLLIAQIALQYYQSQNPDFRGDIDTEEFCQHLGLIKDDKLTNAALILFGINVSKAFPFAKIRIG